MTERLTEQVLQELVEAPTLDAFIEGHDFPAETLSEFLCHMLEKKNQDAETVREWLDYGRLRGLFQWRNSGKGRFEWEEVARD